MENFIIYINMKSSGCKKSKNSTQSKKNLANNQLILASGSMVVRKKPSHQGVPGSLLGPVPLSK